MLSNIAIKLSKSAETAVKKGHPWVFENSIIKGPKDEKENGSLCILFDTKTNKPYAFGLWEQDEIIRIKIIHRANYLKLDTSFWKKQCEIAKEKRRELFENYTNAYRAIHGENDNFPGLILDVYAQNGVLKIYSKIWKNYLDSLLPLLQEVFNLKRIILRFSRKLQDSKYYDYNEGDIIGKDLNKNEVVFEEYNVLFYSNLIEGHKTGFFLDQRPNRYWVQQHAQNKDVLDVFSYVGGFGIHALYAGAKSLTSVDISSHAMDMAKKQISLNKLDSSKWNPLTGDAIKILEDLIRQNKQFDIIILDPPSFAKQESEIKTALKQYERLAELGASLTRKNGSLLLGSCSSRISLEAFKNAHKKVLHPNAWEIHKIVLHDIDHPISFPEGIYLKTIIYQKK